MPKTRNWSAIMLAAGLLLAISFASSSAQVLSLYRVITKKPVIMKNVGRALPGVAGGAGVVLVTPDRSKAEAVQRANPGSTIEEDDFSEEEFREFCTRHPDSCE